MDEDYRRPANDRDRIRAGLALQIVAMATGIPVERMTARSRLQGAACRARWLAMYLAHVTYSWPIERVGLAFGMNRSTAAHACRQVEDERDHPLIDVLMERLERCVRELMDAPAREIRA
jgi:chromosomal replication initiation ATPase DnaA